MADRCGDCPYLNVYPSLWSDVTHNLWEIKDIYNKSDFIIVTPSIWLKNKIEKSILSDKKIYVVYNGVSISKFSSHGQNRCPEKTQLAA